MSMIGTQLSGRYRLESKLGSGGMSTVYLAIDEVLDRQVAVKVLHREISDQEDQLERFRREARAVASLSHPNLVAVIDAGDDGGHPYIVFEYVPGETLKKRIDAEGRLGLDEATAYAIEIGRGLAAAHAARLIHRDVKPQNVLIDAEGRAKITDFGIARSLEVHGLTATGRVLGTTDYVSPEQAMGKEVDARTDVYSLGIVLYEMLTGDVPFHAETQVGVAMKHVNEAVPDVQKKRPETSAALAAALERAVAKDPKDRYPDMNHFLADLEAALEVEVVRAGHSTGEATTVLDSVPRKRRKLVTKRRVSVAGDPAARRGRGRGDRDRRPDRRRRASEQPPPDSQSGGEEIAVNAVEDFDPGRRRRRARRGARAPRPTATRTAPRGRPRPTTPPTSPGIKDGVGIIVDAGEPGLPDRARGADAGARLDGRGLRLRRLLPPTDLDDWEPLSRPVTIEKDEQTIQLNATQPNRYFLLWITDLAPSADGEDGFRVEISDVQLST